MMSLEEFEAIEKQLESPVRALRDKVYGVPSTDHNWNACKSRWLTKEATEWLKAHADIPLP